MFIYLYTFIVSSTVVSIPSLLPPPPPAPSSQSQSYPFLALSTGSLYMFQEQ